MAWKNLTNILCTPMCLRLYLSLCLAFVYVYAHCGKNTRAIFSHTVQTLLCFESQQ